MTKITSETGTIVEHGKWVCPNCGGGNSSKRNRCLACDTERPQPVGLSEGFHPESTENLDKAHSIMEEIDLENLAERGEGKDKALEAASYLRLAVEKKEGNPGDAAERLAFLLVTLGEMKKAKTFAHLALSQDKNSVFACFVLFLLTMNEFDTAQVHTPELDFSGGAELFGSLMFGGAIAAATGINKSSKKGKMLESGRDVGRAFNALMEEKPPWKPGYFIHAGNLLFITAGILYDSYRIKEEYLLKSVLEAPWDELEIPEDMQDEVEDLKARSHGMFLL